MLKTEELRFFTVVAEEKSLAAASRRLNVSASAVTQRLKLIERQLGLRLTHRNGRAMILTDEGRLLAERGASIIAELESLHASLAVRRGTISGNLRVLAPFGFGRKHVAPLCAEFQEANPGVKVDLLLTDRLGRHPEQAWDVAVHIGELHDSALRMRSLATNQRILCAAPSYLAGRVAPLTPLDLEHHQCIVLRENDEDATLWKLSKDGATVSVRVKSTLCSNDGSVVRAWAVAGRGILVRSEWDVMEDIQDGRLIRLLPDYSLPRADIVLLMSSSTESAARTRAFIDLLSQRLAARTQIGRP